MCVFLCSYQPMWFKPIAKRYTPLKAVWALPPIPVFLQTSRIAFC